MYSCKNLADFNINTYKVIEARRSDIAQSEMGKKIKDVSIAGDQAIILKGKAKVAKH